MPPVEKGRTAFVLAFQQPSAASPAPECYCLVVSVFLELCFLLLFFFEVFVLVSCPYTTTTVVVRKAKPSMRVMSLFIVLLLLS